MQIRTTAKSSASAWASRDKQSVVAALKSGVCRERAACAPRVHTLQRGARNATEGVPYKRIWNARHLGGNAHQPVGNVPPCRLRAPLVKSWFIYRRLTGAFRSSRWSTIAPAVVVEVVGGGPLVPASVDLGPCVVSAIGSTTASITVEATINTSVS